MKEEILLIEENEKPSGRATIQLFDAEGKMLQEQKKENYVQERLLRGISKLTARNGFAFNSGLRYLIPSSLYLTAYAEAADPAKEELVAGKLIGIAARSESGSGTLQGAWNEVESVLRSNYLKLVYDFSTSQGNGTFNSIYTGLALVPTTSEKRQLIVTLASMSLPFTASRIAKSGSALYFINLSTQKIYTVQALNFVPSPQLEYTEQQLATTFTIQDVAVRGTEIYYLASGSQIYKAPLSNPSAAVLVTTLSYGASKLGYDEANDRFVTMETLTSSTARYHFCDASFTDLSVKVLYKPSNIYTSTLFSVMARGNTLRINDELVDVESNEVSVLQSGSFDSTYTSDLNNDFLSMGDFGLLLSSSTLNLTAPSTFFSRALLDSPVTKTSQNTMKITYEFTLPTLNIPIV